MNNLFQEYTDEEIREIASQPNPQPVSGEWVLISPNGLQYFSGSPLGCLREEQRARIPVLIALARIHVELMDGDNTGSPLGLDA
jgi:hypothetical protein